MLFITRTKQEWKKTYNRSARREIRNITAVIGTTQGEAVLVLPLLRTTSGRIAINQEVAEDFI
jgi:hypothetical protein